MTSGAATRRGYLDWLRGVAVLIMIEGHTLDSWTRLDERAHPGYGYAVILAGIGAPLFLFLAGIAQVLAAGSRLRRGRSEEEVARAATRRGAEIFALAFLFRLQSWFISGGAPYDTLLKVDILNVMGLAMLGGAALWQLGRTDTQRAFLYTAATVACTMLTPIIRSSGWLSPLPDPVEWYLRPFPGRATFTLFPWAGFLFAGGALGLWLDRARAVPRERWLNVALAVIGPALIAAGYAASYLPPIYAQTSFWTSSPTYFLLRVGVLCSMLPLAYAWNALWRGWSPLQDFGRSSLFVYWIHVEMVYGVLSLPLHKRLTFEQALAALLLFSVVLFAVAKVKERVVAAMRGRVADPAGPPRPQNATR